MKHNSTPSNERACKVRRSYQQPKLEMLGNVVTLTAGYGGMAADTDLGGSGPFPMTMM